MGIFGSRTQTQVGTQVQRVIPDNTLPNAVRSGISKSILYDDDQMVEHVIEDLAASVGLRASRFGNYGRNGYVYGTPRSTLHSSFAGKNATKAAIEASNGPVQLSYYHFGALNDVHYGWMHLVSDYGYDAGGNELTVLSAAKGTKVYLSNMVAVVSNATQAEIDSGALEVWGAAPNAGYTPQRKFMTLDSGIGLLASATPYVVDPAAADHLLVSYCWEEQEALVIAGLPTTTMHTVVKTGTLEIPFTGLDLEASYHQARYVRGNGSVGYFTYAAGVGADPVLDAIFDTAYSAGSQLMPWVYFRFNQQSMGADKTSAAYASSKKLMKLLNMDYDALVAGIDQNPDIADVEQAMMMMAVPAKTTEQVEQRYLFDFFSGVHGDSAQVAGLNNRFSSIGEAALVVRFDDVPQGGIVLQDQRFKMALSYDAIVRRNVPGQIGGIGRHSSGVTGNAHWYRRQVTEVMCEEISVTGLKMTYWVWGDYTTAGDDKNEAILMIPIDQSIVDTYSVPQRELLYARSLHYVFNSRVVTKLAWYQTGIFRAILIVATLVITWVTAGASIQAFFASLAAGAVTSEMLIAAMTMILKYVAEMVAVKLFVHEVGAKLALITAVVAAVAGMYGTLSAESAAAQPAWAKDMLAVSTNLSKAAGAEIKLEFQDLMKESSDFQQYMDEQNQKLKEAEALLGGDNRLDPFIIFGEKPTDFYQRTVHSGNIGVLSMDAVASYTDVALTLPKPYQTLGDSDAS